MERQQHDCSHLAKVSMWTSSMIFSHPWQLAPFSVINIEDPEVCAQAELGVHQYLLSLLWTSEEQPFDAKNTHKGRDHFRLSSSTALDNIWKSSTSAQRSHKIWAADSSMRWTSLPLQRLSMTWPLPHCLIHQTWPSHSLQQKHSEGISDR